MSGQQMDLKSSLTHFSWLYVALLSTRRLIFIKLGANGNK
jgi:hypothetical protein